MEITEKLHFASKYCKTWDTPSSAGRNSDDRLKYLINDCRDFIEDELKIPVKLSYATVPQESGAGQGREGVFVNVSTELLMQMLISIEPNAKRNFVKDHLKKRNPGN